MKQLRSELIEAQRKLEELQNWLYNHTSHPDFMTIARDRNAQTVKVAAIEFKIEQKENGLPLLGDVIRNAETANDRSQASNGFKSKS